MTRERELLVAKATSRTLRRVLRKHRVKFVKYCWFPICDSRGLLVGNPLCCPQTNREARRFRGAVPELMKAVRRTAYAAGYTGPIVLNQYQ